MRIIDPLSFFEPEEYSPQARAATWCVAGSNTQISYTVRVYREYPIFKSICSRFVCDEDHTR